MLRQEPSLQAIVHLSPELCLNLGEFYSNESRLAFILDIACLMQEEERSHEGSPIEKRYEAIVTDLNVFVEVPSELTTYRSACRTLDRLTSSMFSASEEIRSSKSSVIAISSVVYRVEEADTSRLYRAFIRKTGTTSPLRRKIIMGFKRNPRDSTNIPIAIQENLVTLSHRTSSYLDPLNDVFGWQLHRSIFLRGQFTDLLVCGYATLEEATNNAEEYLATLKVA